MQDMYNYWGKTDDNNNYHLLVYHCLDVAAVAEAYLNEHPELLHTMARGLGLEIPQAQALILLFIALHDLGKFSVCFQSKNPVVLNKLNPDRKERNNFPERHDVLGSVIWRKKIYDEFKNCIKKPADLRSRPAFDVLMDSCAGHHGKPVNTIKENLLIQAFDQQDIEAATAFFSACKELFFSNQIIDLTAHDDEEILAELFKRVSWWLSGLTVLADWLGSNRNYFHYKEDNDGLSSYWKNSSS